MLYRMGKFGPAPQSLLIPVEGTNASKLALPEIAITSRIALALKRFKTLALTIQSQA